MIDRDGIRQRYEALQSFLDERGRRLWASAEAKAAGYGDGGSGSGHRLGAEHHRARAQGPGRPEPAAAGPAASAGRGPQALGRDRSAAEAGSRGLGRADRARRSGSAAALDPQEPAPARRRAASPRPPGRTLVGTLLHDLGFSLQANAKTREGGRHPDRDAQFAFINAHVTRALAAGEPVISVDTKKKELVGDFKNAGRAWRPKGSPEEVRVHDFLIKELGRAVPYGVYDLATNAGWVGVGQDHDTAAFAVQTIRRWWQEIGQSRYRAAPRLTITADGGGSNGVRVRLWKRELQKLCDETGLAITVHHLPPGTSKWTRSSMRSCSSARTGEQRLW